VLALALLSVATAACAQSPLPKDVQAVIDRSHKARGDYAVFLTTEVATPARRWTEVEAEFQQGSRHRVEVGSARTLENCDTGESIAYDVAHQHYLDPQGPVKGVCGIDVDVDPIVSGRLLEPVTGPYGRADRIELTGEKFVRLYAVTADGIIVSNNYVPRSPAIGFALTTIRSEVRRGPQDPAMFTRESLARAFAPAAPAEAAAPPPPRPQSR
jgi:hypothetical protein